MPVGLGKLHLEYIGRRRRRVAIPKGQVSQALRGGDGACVCPVGPVHTPCTAAQEGVVLVIGRLDLRLEVHQ